MKSNIILSSHLAHSVREKKLPNQNCPSHLKDMILSTTRALKDCRSTKQPNSNKKPSFTFPLKFKAYIYAKLLVNKTEN